MLLGETPDRARKQEGLAALQEAGVFLIDLKPDPLDNQPLRSWVPDLLRRCRALMPERIILIKASVFDAAYGALAAAGLPVVTIRVPFPGSGQQRRFESAFRTALEATEWTTTVTPPSSATPMEVPRPRAGQATLHEEIARILRENGAMTTAQLADAVNRAGRYRKRDGTPVTAFQIHGRTRNYSQLFEREGTTVRLRSSAP
jgi:hypothetical protein